MLRVMVNGVGGSNGFPTSSIVFSRIQISIETREIAAADLKPHLVTLAKNVACGPQVDGELVHLAGIHQSGLLLGIPVACAKNPLRQILCKSVGPNVHQFGDEVSVHR